MLLSPYTRKCWFMFHVVLKPSKNYGWNMEGQTIVDQLTGLLFLIYFISR